MTASQRRPLMALPLILVGAFDVSAAAQFTPLGFPHARGVNADGTVVVGFDGFQAIRWTSGGIQLLGDLPGGEFRSAAGYVSADGAVIVGDATTESPFTNALDQAFRWTAAEGMVGIFPFGTEQYSHARGITPDGKYIVGYGGEGAGIAYRWSRENGTEVLLAPDQTRVLSNRAFSVSDDGKVIVGNQKQIADAQGTNETVAFRWIEGSGMQILPHLPNSGLSLAEAVSADGQIVVGTSQLSDRSGSEAFLWSASEGIIGLGDLPGGQFSSGAFAVSADGSLVGGSGFAEFGFEAVIWDRQHGMRNLQDVLIQEYGLAAELIGWALHNVYDISADGRFLVGDGVGPRGLEAWMVTIPEPSGVLMGLVPMMLGMRRRRMELKRN